MNNLYVVAVGGSGERILRSFTMALIAGVDIKANKVIPVIVDNDANSRALTNCQDLIRAYRDSKMPGVHALYKNISPEMPTFCHVDIAEPIVLDVSGGNIGDLNNVIGCPSSQGEKDPNDKAIKSLNAERELLFTDSELTMPLNVGFVGCPNIGSVVMNSMSLSDHQFQAVMSASQQDGVIVIGSLFGGTGAAGIPLIVNKLLQTNSTDKPLIGVIAMLPYFQIDTEENQNDTPELKKGGYNVHSDIFDLKTRAALMYYDKHMSKRLDYMYYVGDDNPSTFKKSLGGPNQDNPATICDLMAAMAIVDFTKGDNTEVTTYKKPIWGFSDNENVNSNTSGIFNADLKRSLVKFKMMEQVFIHPDLFPMAVKDEKKTWDFVKDIRFDEAKLASITTDGLISFKDATGLNFIIKAFDKWLRELSDGDQRAVRLTRKLNVFNDGATVEADKLATAFFADTEITGMGLAKWEHHGGGIFGLGKGYDEAVSADLLNALQDAYRKLPKQYGMNIADNQILPVILLYISNALDNVLKNSFNL